MLSIDKIHCTDALKGLKLLPKESVNCVVTSPPYWSVRDYGIPATKWFDGARCVLGLEPSLTAYVDHLCEVFNTIDALQLFKVSPVNLSTILLIPPR